MVQVLAYGYVELANESTKANKQFAEHIEH